MPGEMSNGYEQAARRFMAGRSLEIGVQEIVRWARALPPGAAILDLGCGHGEPVARVLVDEGFTVYGIDPAPTLVKAFRGRIPDAPVRCEPAQTSDFFGRRFDAAIAIGLMFLLPAPDQLGLIGRIPSALLPGGRFLFTAPATAGTWGDALTGCRSESLGAPAYRRALSKAGFELAGEFEDAGGNHYYDARLRQGP